LNQRGSKAPLLPLILKGDSMPAEFFDYKGQVAYREVPITTDPEYNRKVEGLMHHHESRERNGWSKERSLRYAGSIPKDIYFNKIQESKDDEYWTRDKGIKMKRWFNDNPLYRIGEKYIKGGK